MKTAITTILAVGLLALFGQTSFGTTPAIEQANSFSSPAAAASYATTGDLNRTATNSEMVTHILAKKGLEEVGARSFGCTNGCSFGCTTGCTIGCTTGCTIGCR